MPDEDLRNADLSHLRIEDMNEAQRAEMRRRYADFVRRVLRRPDGAGSPPARRKTVTKWVPGMKRPG